MEVDEWVQLTSVIVATFAALASWRAARITAKQFKLNQEEKKLKIKPVLRIRQSVPIPGGFMMEIENKGHPFYHIDCVKFTNDELSVEKSFNGEMGKDRESLRDAFIVTAQHEDKANLEGEFHFDVMDVEGNNYLYKSPKFSIENGKIKNGLDIHKKFLKE